jgi:hypothetical protein
MLDENQIMLQESQQPEDKLLLSVSSWAEFHHNRFMSDVDQGALNERNSDYNKRVGVVQLLDRLQTRLSGAAENVDDPQPSYEQFELQSMLHDIGLKGSDPYAGDAIEPGWDSLAKKLGIGIDDKQENVGNTKTYEQSITQNRQSSRISGPSLGH